MNIIIPMNGLGKRFKSDSYTEPKPLIKVLGKEMIFRVVESLNIKKDDTITLIYNESLNDHNIISSIQNQFRNIKFNFIGLKFETRGAAETVLCGLNNFNQAELNKPCMLTDCDTLYHQDVVSLYKNKDIYGKNAIFYFLDNQDKPIYSYIKIKNNFVIDIKEKEKISNYANTGIYCFESATLLKRYCEKLLNSGERSNNEFYISDIYKKMLKEKNKILSIKVEKFSPLGTPLQLKSFCAGKTKEKMRFCFDLDNTLVTYPTVVKDYRTVKPIESVISYLKYLKSQGHTIIIYTARRMLTHKGNVGKVIADIGKCTIDTLEKYNIPYDELCFGKPIADFYIDDKSINPKFDLEKLTGYYNTSVPPRSFNTITITGNTVEKKGKINGEKYWYKNIPYSLKKMIPIIKEINQDSIIMEKINGVPFSYLYVNCSLTEENFKTLLSSIHKMHKTGTSHFIEDSTIYSNYVPKIKNRYDLNFYKKFENSEKIYNYLVEKLKVYQKNSLGIPSVIHGDPVFTNIFLDVNNDIKLIDPRGRAGDKLTIYGDVFYDYAKIYQSLIGYDRILNGKDAKSEYSQKFKLIFLNHVEKIYSIQAIDYIKLITCSHLFSLLPLHDCVKKNQKFYNLLYDLYLSISKK